MPCLDSQGFPAAAAIPFKGELHETGVKEWTAADLGRNLHAAMPSRGRHRTTSKECHRTMRGIEALDGVAAVIIGRSYGGKSLGTDCATGAVRIQRKVPGGLKGVTQSAKGLQEIFIRTEAGREEGIAAAIAKMQGGGPASEAR